MIAFLSGGTGTPKLIWGMRDLIDDAEIGVVVNTAEDMWISGNHLSPDIDTLIYLFADLVDTKTWWGIEGDTFHTHEAMRRLGYEELLTIGDRDRGTHIVRGEMIRKGSRLTAATARICEQQGITATILPMSDVPVESMVTTSTGEMHFQEFWVKHRGKVPISGVYRRSPSPPQITNEVRAVIDRSEAVIIGPSNPVTSIMPILECPGMRDVLEGRPVAAVSPFIGDQPVSGPAGVLMKACGRKPNSTGTYELYQGLAPVFIQDIRDEGTVHGAHRLDTLMTTHEKARNLAESVLKIMNIKR